MDELLAQFLIEGREQALEAGADLAALQRGPADPARLDRCFRAVHTLKGSADLLGLTPMGRVLHAAEDVLGRLRGGQGEGGDFSVLLEVADQVERWLDDLDTVGVLPESASAASQALIARLAGDGAAPQVAAADDWDGASAFPGRAGVAIRYRPRADGYFAGDDPIAIIKAVPDLAQLRVSLAEPVADPALYDPFRCTLVIEALSTAALPAVETALRLVRDQVALATLRAAEAFAPAGVEVETARRTLRIDAARVDQLADLSDQLVVAKGGLIELAAQAERGGDGQALGQALRAKQAELDRLVAALHTTVGQARMTPLAPLLGRFPRLVREIAATLGKPAALEIEGGEVEVDKAVVDGLFEPLLHLLRNALDHGVERPEARTAAGKPAQALVRLSARTVGDQAVIEVVDDGAGVDPARVRDRAVARGLIDATSAEAMSDAALVDLIFLPGFSTAETVSSVSGRGVGMDAVRAAVTRLGGRVEIDSRPGLGTTVRLALPIRMVLAKLLVVESAGERFGLPLDGVAEIARVPADRIFPIRAGRAFVLRDEVVPLVDLAQALGAEAGPSSDRVVVAGVGGEPVGFAVDAVVERIDAVVRPMAGLLAGARGVSGSTLTADGSVMLVLDLAELLA
ncbi:chemotaxis protein CheA [Caulobacter hibisci]|uniref:histidine kinase n=1 Tax=Caulobacter hibisci TaxID=2035993 RepID=A0ABS0T1I2_9CAUL|nr:chemotaxis protein CheA [Caulobacter hibisci]